MAYCHIVAKPLGVHARTGDDVELIRTSMVPCICPVVWERPNETRPVQFVLQAGDGAGADWSELCWKVNLG
jgi:hypothetical protein